TVLVSMHRSSLSQRWRLLEASPSRSTTHLQDHPRRLCATPRFLTVQAGSTRYRVSRDAGDSFVMPDRRDDDWENEFSEDAPTRLDEAIPDPVPSKDSTGKYKTLPGFAEAVEHASEHYEAQGEIRGMRRVFTALRLLRIGAGDHPDRAGVQIERLK